MAARHSVPKPDGFLTFMVVLTRRTFKWTVYTKHAIWTVGSILAVWCILMVFSAYGLLATKKMMSFDELQRETREQQEQLKESLEQAGMLQAQLSELQEMVQNLMKQIDPKAESAGSAGSAGSLDALGGPAAGGLYSKPGGSDIGKLQSDLKSIDGRLKLYATQMAPVLYRAKHTPSIAPTAGYISSGYGARIHPFSRAGGEGDGLMSFHAGIDIANEMGTPVQATADGELTFADWEANYGLMVVIRHSPELETVYAHLQSVNKELKVGMKVERGRIIGQMGRTGRATGVHLHYEVRKNGQPTNPTPYLKLQKQWLTGLK